MKKLIGVVIVLIVVVSACGPNTDELEAKRIADSTRVADSLAQIAYNDSVQAAEEAAAAANAAAAAAAAAANDATDDGGEATDDGGDDATRPGATGDDDGGRPGAVDTKTETKKEGGRPGAKTK